MKKLLLTLFALIFVSTLAHAVPRYDNLTITAYNDWSRTVVNSSNNTVMLNGSVLIRIKSTLPRAFRFRGPDGNKIFTDSLYYISGLDPLRNRVIDNSVLYHYIVFDPITRQSYVYKLTDANLVEGVYYYYKEYAPNEEQVRLGVKSGITNGELTYLKIFINEKLLNGQVGQWGGIYDLDSQEFHINIDTDDSDALLGYWHVNPMDNSVIGGAVAFHMQPGYVSPKGSILDQVSSHGFTIRYYLGEQPVVCNVESEFVLADTKIVKGTSINLRQFGDNQVSVRITKARAVDSPFDTVLRLNMPVQHFGLTYTLVKETAGNKRIAVIRVSSCGDIILNNEPAGDIEKKIEIPPADVPPRVVVRPPEGDGSENPFYLAKGSTEKPDFVTGIVNWVKAIFGE